MRISIAAAGGRRCRPPGVTPRSRGFRHLKIRKVTWPPPRARCHAVIDLAVRQPFDRPAPGVAATCWRPRRSAPSQNRARAGHDEVSRTLSSLSAASNALIQCRLQCALRLELVGPIQVMVRISTRRSRIMIVLVGHGCSSGFSFVIFFSYIAGLTRPSIR